MERISSEEEADFLMPEQAIAQLINSKVG